MRRNTRSTTASSSKSASTSSRKLRSPKRSDYQETRNLPKILTKNIVSLSTKSVKGAKAKSAFDPFAPLLKEKERRDARLKKASRTEKGLTGGLTFKLKEPPAAPSSARVPLGDVEDESLSTFLPTTPTSGSLDGDIDVDKVFGDKVGEELGIDAKEVQGLKALLAQAMQEDKVDKGKEKKEIVLGMQFWEELVDENAMNIEVALPSLGDLGGLKHPALRLLKRFIDCKGLSAHPFVVAFAHACVDTKGVRYVLDGDLAEILSQTVTGISWLLDISMLRSLSTLA